MISCAVAPYGQIISTMARIWKGRYKIKRKIKRRSCKLEYLFRRARYVCHIAMIKSCAAFHPFSVLRDTAAVYCCRPSTICLSLPANYRLHHSSGYCPFLLPVSLKANLVIRYGILRFERASRPDPKNEIDKGRGLGHNDGNEVHWKRMDD